MPNIQRQIIQKTIWGLIGGAAIWLILLMQTSSHIRTAVVGSSADVAIGPLVLNHLGKQAAAGGAYTVSFSFEKGLIWFLIGFMMLGAVAGLAVAKLKPASTQ